jgi:hypothetical protein
MNQKFNCECGSKIINTNSSINKHNETKKHSKYMTEKFKKIKEDKDNNITNDIDNKVYKKTELENVFCNDILNIIYGYDHSFNHNKVMNQLNEVIDDWKEDKKWRKENDSHYPGYTFYTSLYDSTMPFFKSSTFFYKKIFIKPEYRTIHRFNIDFMNFILFSEYLQPFWDKHKWTYTEEQLYKYLIKKIKLNKKIKFNKK